MIFDLSGSMGNKIEKSREAVVEFFRTANPQDEFFMVSFNDRRNCFQTLPVPSKTSRPNWSTPRPRVELRLMDAIYMGLHQMKNAHQQKKALLIISDGGDNHSRYTENEIKSIVKEADVQIYGIGIFDNAPQLLKKKWVR